MAISRQISMLLIPVWMSGYANFGVGFRGPLEEVRKDTTSFCAALVCGEELNA